MIKHLTRKIKNVTKKVGFGVQVARIATGGKIDGALTKVENGETIVNKALEIFELGKGLFK